jgi:hypothetical protein
MAPVAEAPNNAPLTLLMEFVMAISAAAVTFRQLAFAALGLYVVTVGAARIPGVAQNRTGRDVAIKSEKAKAPATPAF